MTIETISRNALRLWQIMNDGTTWCYHKLRQISQLPDRDINAAIGWLAREDSIEIAQDPVSNEELYTIKQFWDLENFSKN